jgi:hypothetical protein
MSALSAWLIWLGTGFGLTFLMLGAMYLAGEFRWGTAPRSSRSDSRPMPYGVPYSVETVADVRERADATAEQMYERQRGIVLQAHEHAVRRAGEQQGHSGSG